MTPYGSSVHITCQLRTIIHRFFLSKVGLGFKLELLCCNYVNDAQGKELVSPQSKSRGLYFLIKSTFVPDALCAMKRDSIFFNFAGSRWRNYAINHSAASKLACETHCCDAN